MQDDVPNAPDRLEDLPPAEPYLRLARLGVKTWNQWVSGQIPSWEQRQLAHQLILEALPSPSHPIQFGGVDFSSPENQGIRFTQSGASNSEFARFPKGAVFSGARFPKGFGFQRVQFGGPADFSGVEFLNDADFSGADFQGAVDFSGARFNGHAQFPAVAFHNSVKFHEAVFLGTADFKTSGFAVDTDFSWALFEGVSTFSGAKFQELSIFTGSRFLGTVNFSGGNFQDGAQFDECRFAEEADFSNRVFRQKASFIGARFDKPARFDGAVMGEVAVFDQATFADLASFKAGNQNAAFFHDTFFAESRFEGLADFSGREFKGPVSFRGGRFAEPPEFASTKGHERIDPVEMRIGISGHGPGLLPWKKARDWVERFKPRWWAVRLGGDPRVEGWTVDSDKLARIRRLRKIMADIHSGDQERDLFVLERKAERGVLLQRWRDWKKDGRKGQTPLWPYGPILLLWLFDLLSDCGRSAKRPLGWFGAKLLAFWFLYLWLVDRPMCMTTGQFREDVASFALGHALPFVGSLNPARDAALRRLFEDGAKLDVPFGIELISSGQSILGALLLFLVLQAVRNHFRLK